MKRGGGILAVVIGLLFGVTVQNLAAQGLGQPAVQPVADMQTVRAAAGAAFLTRIRLADPDYRMILMACLKENELNLLLSRFVKPEEIPLLVKGLAGQLSHSLPGQDLRVVAFRPIVPLHEAGIAVLNSATGEITYQGF